MVEESKKRRKKGVETLKVKDIIRKLQDLPKDAKCVDVEGGDIVIEYHEESNEVQIK